MDRYSELTETMLWCTTTTHDVVKAFTKHWGFSHGLPSKLLSENWNLFTARLFTDVCRILGMCNVFTILCYQQTNSQAEQFNRTLSAALRYYIVDHPCTSGELIDALSYAYITQRHGGTVLSLIKLVFARPPPTLAIGTRSAIMRKHSPPQWYIHQKSRLATLIKTANNPLRKAQTWYKRFFDVRRHRTIGNVSQDDPIFVQATLADQTQKLAPIATGPFSVVAVDTHTITVQRLDSSVEKISCNLISNAFTTNKNSNHDTHPKDYDHSVTLDSPNLRRPHIFASHETFKQRGKACELFDFGAASLHDVE